MTSEREVIVVEYNPRCAGAFEAEARRLKELFVGTEVHVEHIIGIPAAARLGATPGAA
jgi:GrpB-like predicted nucleotidyltransferase (UPF0157 family)